MTSEFLKQSDLPRDEIEAGLDSGELVLWRVDAEGEQWYQHLPAEIKAVPSETARQIEGGGDDCD